MKILNGVEAGKIAGKMGCFNCGEDVDVKVNISGHYGYMCNWHKTGCGCQFLSRTADADEYVFKRLKPLAAAKKESAQVSEAKPKKEAVRNDDQEESGGMFGGMFS